MFPEPSTNYPKRHIPVILVNTYLSMMLPDTQQRQDRLSRILRYLEPNSRSWTRLMRYKGTFYLTVATVPALGVTKLSIIFFYRRIFVGERFRIWINIATLIVVCYTIAFTFGTLAWCIPISTNWAPYETRYDSAKCVNENDLLATWGIIDILTDVMVLVIPLFMISKLHMPLRRKIAVSAIFAVGFLSVSSP